MRLCTGYYICGFTLTCIIYLSGGADPDITPMGEVSVDNHLHFIWLGKPKEILMEYLRIWRKLNPDIDITLWTDAKASLVGILNKKITAIVDDRIIKTNKLFEYNLATTKLALTMSIQDKIWDYANNVISTLDNRNNINLNSLIKEGLINLNLGRETTRELIDEMSAFEQECEESFHHIEHSDQNIKVRQMNSLTDSEFTKFPEFYAREILLRQNAAAASDIARIEILNNNGGIYLDADMLPGIDKTLWNKLLENLGHVHDDNYYEEYLAAALTQELFDTWTSEGYEMPARQNMRHPKKDQPGYPDSIAILEDRYGKGTMLAREVQNIEPNPLKWFTVIQDIKVPVSTGCAIAIGMNAAIASIPGSRGLKAIAHEISQTYDLMQTAGYLEFNPDRHDLHRPFNEDRELRLAGHLEILKTNLEKISRYRGDGYDTSADATMHVTGPVVVIRAMELAQDPGSGSAYYLPDTGIFNACSEEQAFSSWRENRIPLPMRVAQNNFRYVLQMGDTTEEVDATNSILAKSNRKEARDARLGQYDPITTTFKHPTRLTPMEIEVGKTVKIAIVGHGNRLYLWAYTGWLRKTQIYTYLIQLFSDISRWIHFWI